MPKRFFTPSQRRAVFAILRKKGLLKSFVASKPRSPGLSPSSWIPRSSVSGRHVADFRSLLDTGEKPQVALDKIRYGGILPKLAPDDLALVKSVIDHPAGFGKLSRSVFEEGMLSEKFAPHLYSIHSGEARGTVEGGLFGSWWGSSTSVGAWRLRVLAQQTLGRDMPKTRLMRPEARKVLRSDEWRRWSKEDIRELQEGPFSVEEKNYFLHLYGLNQAILDRKSKSSFVTVYRGVMGEQAAKVSQSLKEGGFAVLDTDTLSSWTPDRGLASAFGIMVVKAKVHKSRLITSHLSHGGNPSDRQAYQEYIVFGDRFWITQEDILPES